MAGMKCICGMTLSNVYSPNDMELIVFTDREWEKIMEDIKNGGDIYDIEPKNVIWKCIQCERIYIFENNKVIKRYSLEEFNN